jgi:hypothetical protein
MKKTLIFIFVFIVFATFIYAQVDTTTAGPGDIVKGGPGSIDKEGVEEAAEKGLDMMSLGIGLLVGLVGGYFAGSRMGKKE